MFKDTEQSYGDFTLDVYEHIGGDWCCDFWLRRDPSKCGTVQARFRKDAIRMAKETIDDAIRDGVL